MKFRNPETGEVFDCINEALNQYCFGKACNEQSCKLEKYDGFKQTCSMWAEDHPHEAARLMGYEVVEDEPNVAMANEIQRISDAAKESAKIIQDYLNKGKEANMDKPRICEILRVEPGESFYIQGFDGVLFWIMDDGTFTTQPNNAPGSASALLRTLDHPERIIRKPRFTEQEVEFARLFKAACKNVVWIQRNDEKTLVWVVEHSKEEYRLPFRLFPSIQLGQSYTLDEIIGGAE